MIRLKLILRNIFQKPLRSAAVIISIAAAAFAALFCISGISTAKTQIYAFLTANFGDTEIIVSSTSMGTLDISEDELPSECNYVTASYASTSFTIRNNEYYNYVNKVNSNIIGIDADEFYNFHMLEEPCDITDGGVTITKALALKLQKEQGDELVINGQDSKSYKVKINKILDNKKFLLNNLYCILTTQEFANKIACRDNGFTMMFIDSNGQDADKVAADLREKHPTYLINGMVSASAADAGGSMVSIYYLVFAMVVLMVGFIVVSMSKHIINERMAVIGMLRSIGGSIKNTSIILFAESAAYGLFGGIIGSVLFLLFKDSFVLGMLMPVGAENLEFSDGINFFSVTFVIIAMMALQCGFSAAAILKGSRTPIRDIIFDTKDTLYKPSKKLYIIGAALLAVGILLYILIDGFVSSVLAVFLSVIGAVLVYPFIMRLISKLAMKLFERSDKPIAKLASLEAGTKKSSVYSAQLIFSAISLTMAVLMLSVSVLTVFAYTKDCDIQISNISKTSEKYGYISEISGVTDVKFNYYTSMSYDSFAYVNDIETPLIVLSDINKQFEDMPDSVGEDEIVFDKSLARRLGVKVGDTVVLKLKNDTYLPAALSLKVVSLCNTIHFDMSCKTVIINHDTYVSVYDDVPQSIEIKTEPGTTAQVMKMLNLTNSESDANINTTEELKMMNAESTSGITSILYVLIALGLILSVLGTANNMLIGFEQSKRKYAVFYSVAMSREKIKKLILIETVFLSSVSIVIASIVSVYFLNVINKALGSLDMSVPLVTNPLYMIMFAIIIMLLITATSFKPVRSLSKMMISEEIKISTD